MTKWIWVSNCPIEKSMKARKPHRNSIFVLLVFFCLLLIVVLSAVIVILLIFVSASLILSILIVIPVSGIIVTSTVPSLDTVSSAQCPHNYPLSQEIHTWP
jgi:hypothetical protein